MANRAAFNQERVDHFEERITSLIDERDEASAFAETQQAGMKEVALFRAANAQGQLGTFARPLLNEVKRLRAALEAIAKEPAPGSTIYCRRTAKEALDGR